MPIYGCSQSSLYALILVRVGMGGLNRYCGIVSGGNTICSFRQFLAKTYRFATVQNVADRRHTVPKARPIVRSAKNGFIY